MKRLFLLTLVCTLLIAAAPAGSLAGWTVSGQVMTVKDARKGVLDAERFSAEGYGNGGTISQTVNLTPATYMYLVTCKGSGVFTVYQPSTGYTVSSTCSFPKWDLLPTWAVIPASGDVIVSAQLGIGDYADMLCFYPLDEHGAGNCSPNLITNFSFEGK